MRTKRPARDGCPRLRCWNSVGEAFACERPDGRALQMPSSLVAKGANEFFYHLQKRRENICLTKTDLGHKSGHHQSDSGPTFCPRSDVSGLQFGPALGLWKLIDTSNTGRRELVFVSTYTEVTKTMAFPKRILASNLATTGPCRARPRAQGVIFRCFDLGLLWARGVHKHVFKQLLFS